ncbi:MAG TPA: hypothetical protein VN455_06240 [Methanotrichaceae archaeon]|nr:hypothetical protein [Methanotrichaceae archaeon]
MRRVMLALITLGLIIPSLAITDYQRGVLDGLNNGWAMGQKYNQAQSGDISAYNQAVPQFNSWITGIFGKNESLMLTNMSATANVQPYPYVFSKTFAPVHAIDSSWNQSVQITPQPDASGKIHGFDAETYETWGPGIEI